MGHAKFSVKQKQQGLKPPFYLLALGGATKVVPCYKAPAF
jgi:hypothetical protein